MSAYHVCQHGKNPAKCRDCARAAKAVTAAQLRESLRIAESCALANKAECEKLRAALKAVLTAWASANPDDMGDAVYSARTALSAAVTP